MKDFQTGKLIKCANQQINSQQVVKLIEERLEGKNS